jgi:hypothetical protein
MVVQDKQLDLVKLLNMGKHGKIRFGSTLLKELQEILSDDDCSLEEYENAPLKQMLSCNGIDFGFYGNDSVFAVIQGEFQYISAGFPGERPVDYGLISPSVGELEVVLGKQDWKNIQTLPGGINSGLTHECELSANKEKQIVVSWRKCTRVLRFQYQLEAHQRDEGIYELDYILKGMELREEAIAPKT